jgi:2,5-diamino-6-(ribosylamino)-4(3H)-pyrimidinone 5'-phosphate reductase
MVKQARQTMQKNDANARAETTLFLLVSADGKITSGQSDALDPDWDWKRIHGVKEGLGQYYQIEQTTDLFSMITGKVLAKLRPEAPEMLQENPDNPPFLNSIVVDSKPWLTPQDLQRQVRRLKHLYLVTSNAEHPAFSMQGSVDNLTVIHYSGSVDFADLFRKMKQDYGAPRITIQSGGTLNSTLVRAGLVDHILLVVAPLLVGGEGTPSAMDGASFQTEAELLGLKALRLTKCEALSDSYVRLTYDLIQETVVDPK